MMLLIGNGVGIFTLIFFTPFFISNMEMHADTALNFTNDEGKIKINETLEFYKIVIYVAPITVLNTIIIIMHFHFARYERELKRKYRYD